MASSVLGLTLILALALVPDAVAAGGVYEWTDGNGSIHFTDDPGKIPKKFHDTVLELRPPIRRNRMASLLGKTRSPLRHRRHRQNPRPNPTLPS
jgi:hypothetical protein